MSDALDKSHFSRRVALTGAAGLMLSGCANIIGPSASPRLYLLHPPLPRNSTAPNVSWQLSVAVPQAAASLDTVRIALSPSRTTMDYFANAAWADRSPILLQGMIVESFESTGKIVAVARDTTGIGANYLLQTELRDFQARYDSPPDPKGMTPPPTVVVRMECNLFAMPQRKIVQSRSFMHESTAQVNTVDGVTVAFDEALGAVLSEIVDWTLRAPAIS